MHFRLAILSLLFVASGVSYAHQDSVVLISPDGKLEGLPEQFQPALLEVEFSGTGRSKRPSMITLTVGGFSTVVPACAVQIMKANGMELVGASASWYHTGSTLPPYVNVSFLDPGEGTEVWPRSGATLLFNLETSKLLRMEAAVADKKEGSVKGYAVDLSQYCGAAELANFYTPLTGRP